MRPAGAIRSSFTCCGRRQAAIEMLEHGLELSVAGGALALEERARTELSAAGLRPRRRRITGRDALTGAEQRVAQLAAQGLTNREIAQTLFVSLRTVETHLTHSYQKLGIESRAQLAAALAVASTDRTGPLGPTDAELGESGHVRLG
jgi:DNA-binding CsgD family transcriptional regulator